MQFHKHLNEKVNSCSVHDLVAIQLCTIYKTMPKHVYQSSGRFAQGPSPPTIAHAYSKPAYQHDGVYEPFLENVSSPEREPMHAAFFYYMLQRAHYYLFLLQLRGVRAIFRLKFYYALFLFPSCLHLSIANSSTHSPSAVNHTRFLSGTEIETKYVSWQVLLPTLADQTCRLLSRHDRWSSWLEETTVRTGDIVRSVPRSRIESPSRGLRKCKLLPSWISKVCPLKDNVFLRSKQRIS